MTRRGLKDEGRFRFLGLGTFGKTVLRLITKVLKKSFLNSRDLRGEGE